jgi:hypothetical protein
MDEVRAGCFKVACVNTWTLRRFLKRIPEPSITDVERNVFWNPGTAQIAINYAAANMPCQTNIPIINPMLAVKAGPPHV